ncbi:hypothetical protein A3D70_00790 [Candidatus Adlerbacteria bacterium RIFCSPHIGHO2_02_FULL_54_18]|uniref:Anticodon-binding domain-containing protein n=2 Tax=Candidatus Adleribacteriota TaxID=1752736 RepID=A0A1F4Y1G7_9BACT|nr:MAG: hypothetical protein A2949_00795 [Candidatus Adlerbacteria bacterium RIFCSPLOWO2_01_FULL_54_21b]OGC87820.1 MAG: hypothetical protein A3D70_00790 [Candidatus Adlerbacteria bacterium RIFCSPHIGHO2_02_FULL_54_18]
MPAPLSASPASFLKHAAEVASFYGFRPLREMERSIPGTASRAHSFATASGVCVRCLAARPEEPVLIYWANGSPMHVPHNLTEAPIAGNRGTIGEFGLHIVGVEESLAEVVLLKTVATILSEWGAAVARVRINALGDKDSRTRFEREVSLYVRKNAAHLDSECREILPHNSMAPYRCSSEQCRSVTLAGPRAMNFLSEKSRLHFREVLEHLEKLSLPYEFDDMLMLDEREPRMLFAFDLAGEDATVVGGLGGRFDDYLRRLSPRPAIVDGKTSAGVSASVYFRKKGLLAQRFKLAAPSGVPSVYFIQLGLRAKLEGLAVVDLLRAAGVPILQSFNSSKLTPQLAAAREAGVSHLLIMGAREALDRTILVRSMDNSSQQIVGLAELPRFLKTFR